MLNYVINKIQNLKSSTNDDSSQIQNLKSSGYAKHSLSIIRDNTLSNTSKVIYIALCSYAGSKDIAYPTIKRLIGELNISKTKFYRHIQPLKKRGYINIKQSIKDGKYSSNIYTINDNVPRVTSNSLQNPAPYGRHDNAIIKDKTLSDTSKVIYCLLCGYAGNKSTAYPSVNRILKELGMSSYKFYKHLEPLKERGYIEVTRTFKDGKYSSNVYTINDSVPRNPSSLLQNLNKPKNTDKPKTDSEPGGNTCIASDKIEAPKSVHTETLSLNQKKLATPSPLQQEYDRISMTKFTSKNSSTENEYPKNEYTQNSETKKDLNLLKEKILKENLSKSKSMSKSIPEPYKHTQNQKERNDIETMETYIEIIKENIDYKSLLITHKSQKELIDNMLDIIIDAVMSKSNTIRVHQQDKPTAVVKSVLLKLKYTNIVHAIERFNSVTNPVKRIHAYLLTVLYSSKLESDAHYTNLYNSRA